MNSPQIASLFAAAILSQPAAAALPRNVIAAVAKCSDEEEFYARFVGAPDRILSQLGTVLYGTTVSVEGLCIRPCRWVSRLRKLKAADKEAKEFAAAHPGEAARFPSHEALRSAFVRGEVVIGDGPKTKNWDYEDDYPGDYVDSAYTRSREIHPGVWSELKHTLNGTRKWTVVLRA